VFAQRQQQQVLPLCRRASLQTRQQMQKQEESSCQMPRRESRSFRCV
jgi:hypothetical protein